MQLCTDFLGLLKKLLKMRVSHVFRICWTANLTMFIVRVQLKELNRIMKFKVNLILESSPLNNLKMSRRRT